MAVVGSYKNTWQEGHFLTNFHQMSDKDKAFMLRQMADVLAILQQHQLPATIRDYGGLDFSPSGMYVSAPLSIMDAGPFTSYAGFVKATIQSELAKADTDPQVQGWRANGVRARLDKFIAEGLHVAMENTGTFPKVLVHADFSMCRAVTTESCSLATLTRNKPLTTSCMIRVPCV